MNLFVIVSKGESKMKCRDCGTTMIIMDEKHYSKFEDWRPQSYVCPECGRIDFI